MFMACYLFVHVVARVYVILFVYSGSGKVEFNEFLAMMSRSSQGKPQQQKDLERKTEEEEMRQAFRIFDIDGNGFVDASELKLTMANLGENLTDKDVKNMLKIADRNKDGRIDYEGLCKKYVYKCNMDFLTF